MSVKFKFENGKIGTISEKVAEIFEKRGKGKIIKSAGRPAADGGDNGSDKGGEK